MIRSQLRKWTFQILRFLAKRRLQKLHPTVVGITGTAGKTSAKEAITDVLSRRFKVKKTQKNLNSEFGVALSILELKKDYSWLNATRVFEWVTILWAGLKDTFQSPEPCDIFVVEMGVDHPGAMDDILQVVRPDIMVFLNVKDAHIGEGHFPNKQAIFNEKTKACAAVPKQGWVVLNRDDAFVRQLISHLPANTLTIGTEEESDLRATEVMMDGEGLRFTLAYEDKKLSVHLPHVLGRHHITMVLSAVAVAFLMGMPWKAIALALEEYQLPPGRMSKIEGKNGSLIIDSSHNASPDTMSAALEILGFFHGRKIAALGTMNELGPLSESEHVKIGKLAAKYADMLLAVGDQAKEYAEGAERGGMSASMIHTFKTSKEAGQFLSNILERNDVVLAKGSQNKVRMEHLVKMCMKEPEKARQLLVRQEPYWLKYVS